MTFLDLQNLVAYNLDDLQFGYFTPTQVKVWLNNAQKRVQKMLIDAGQNYYLTCAQTTMLANQSDYSCPLDFKKLHRMEVILSGSPPNEAIARVLPITLNQQDLVTRGAGTPAVYVIKRNKFTLFPAPDTALVLRIQYTYEVGDMSLDTDLPDAPASYHELVALLACEDGFLKDGRVNDLLLKKIAKFESELKTDSQERQQDLPRNIVMTGNGYGGGGYNW